MSVCDILVSRTDGGKAVAFADGGHSHMQTDWHRSDFQEHNHMLEITSQKKENLDAAARLIKSTPGSPKLFPTGGRVW